MAMNIPDLTKAAAAWASILSFALLTGCGPSVTVGELPALPSVPTEHFLAAVGDQLESLAAAVAEDPLSGKKTGRLGMAYLAYQLDDAAEVALRRARLLQPRKFEWMYYHAEALTRLGRFNEAMTSLQEAIDRKPRYLPARTHLGLLYMQLGDLEIAEAYLREAVDDRPENTEARLALARLYLQIDKPYEAREHLEYLIGKVGHSGSAYFALADSWRRTGDRDKAAEYFELFEKYRGVGLPINDSLLRAVADLDLSEKPLLRKATRLNQLGKTDEAIKTLQLALDRNPRSDLTHAALVGAFGAMQQFDKVEEHYRLALESAPPTAALLRNLGRARFFERKLLDAQKAFEEALELNPYDSFAMAWLGIVRMQRNDIEGSLALWENALEINPRESTARLNLASVLRKLGRHSEALVHMKELVRVEDEHSPRVWREMGESYLVLGQTAEARDAITAAVASAERLNDDSEARLSASLLQSIGE